MMVRVSCFLQGRPYMPADTFCTDLSHTHADIRSVLSLVQFREMIIEFIPFENLPQFFQKS